MPTCPMCGTFNPTYKCATCDTRKINEEESRRTRDASEREAQRTRESFEREARLNREAIEKASQINAAINIAQHLQQKEHAERLEKQQRNFHEKQLAELAKQTKILEEQSISAQDAYRQGYSVSHVRSAGGLSVYDFIFLNPFISERLTNAYSDGAKKKIKEVTDDYLNFKNFFCDLFGNIASEINSIFKSNFENKQSPSEFFYGNSYIIQLDSGLYCIEGWLLYKETKIIIELKLNMRLEYNEENGFARFAAGKDGVLYNQHEVNKDVRDAIFRKLDLEFGLHEYINSSKFRNRRVQRFKKIALENKIKDAREKLDSDLNILQELFEKRADIESSKKQAEEYKRHSGRKAAIFGGIIGTLSVMSYFGSLPNLGLFLMVIAMILVAIFAISMEENKESVLLIKDLENKINEIREQAARSQIELSELEKAIQTQR
jgi:hypothetical protein